MAKKTRRKKVKRRRTRKKKAGQPSEEEKEMLDWMPDLYVPPTPPRGSPHLTPETSSSLFYRSQPLVDPAWGWGGQFGKHSFLVSSDPPYTDSKGVEHSRKSPFNGLFWSNQNQYLAMYMHLLLLIQQDLFLIFVHHLQELWGGRHYFFLGLLL